MFKLRNIAGVALVLGVAAGVWLSDVWKGIGSGEGIGVGNGKTVVSLESGDATDAAPELGVEGPASTTNAGKTLRVVIRDRSYFLKNGAKETPTTLDELVQSLRGVSGDDDGVKLRVYRAENARVTADVQLREALQAADVPEAATYWSNDIAPCFTPHTEAQG
jgi:hypothetical protein